MTLFHGLQLALAVLALSYGLWVVWLTIGLEALPSLPLRSVRRALHGDLYRFGAFIRERAAGSALSQCLDETILENVATEEDVTTMWVGCVADARDRALFRLRPLRLVAFVASSTGVVGALFFARAGIGTHGSPAVSHAILAMINGTLLSTVCLVARAMAAASVVQTMDELFKVQRAAIRSDS